MVLSITILIKKFLKDNGITQVYLAELLKESPQNLANKLRKNDLNTDYIRRVSVALNHDFFFELSLQLKSELKADAQIRTKTGSAASANADSGYVRPEQYIRLLEENLDLYRELLKAGKE